MSPISIRRRLKPAPCFDNNESCSEGIPVSQDSRTTQAQYTPFQNSLRKIIKADSRTKPAYADCWLTGSSSVLTIFEEYDTDNGHVVIGRAPNGEIEYNLMPIEYDVPDSVNLIIEDAISEIRSDYRRRGGRSDRFYLNSLTRDILSQHADALGRTCSGYRMTYEEMVRKICDITYRYTVGLGIFDILLSDPRLEDIYIDAPCEKNRIHVTLSSMNGMNAHERCRTNLIVDEKEVMNLICHLKKINGQPFCESNPVLETDMKKHDARATVVGYPLSPNGNAVAIRKHSRKPWTLTRLIANGTIDHATAGLLSFLVQNRATFLVCGARGAGKSSLLSALMFEFPVSQRILTVEDTIELPADKMRRMGYKVQSMLINENSSSDSKNMVKTSLRLGESAIVYGEIRNEDGRALYESMRTGRAGSSIMGTIHGDSAKSVYDRVVHDMGIAPEAFMATEVLATLGTVRDRKTGAQIRRMNELVATSDRIGEFIDLSSSIDFSAPVMRRALSTSGMTAEEARTEIRARGEIRRLLADKSSEDSKYLNPEWIGMANEYVSRNTGKPAEVLIDGFKKIVESTE